MISDISPLSYAEICSNAPRYQSFASTGIIVVVIMMALGIVLIIIGVLKKYSLRLPTI